MNSFLRTSQKIKRLRSRSKPLLLPIAIVAIGLVGGLPILLLSLIGGITAASLLSRHRTDQLLDRLATSAGGWHVLFCAIAAIFGVSPVAHGQPAYALSDGAKEAT